MYNFPISQYPFPTCQKKANSRRDFWVLTKMHHGIQMFKMGGDEREEAGGRCDGEGRKNGWWGKGGGETESCPESADEDGAGLAVLALVEAVGPLPAPPHDGAGIIPTAGCGIDGWYQASF